jgi:hypothetical protein
MTGGFFKMFNGGAVVPGMSVIHGLPIVELTDKADTQVI